MNIWITVRNSRFAFSWALDIEEVREYFKEVREEGDSWDEWVKPVSVDDKGLEELGKHILFGQIESMEQSDFFPHEAFWPPGPRKEYLGKVLYGLKHVEDDE